MGLNGDVPPVDGLSPNEEYERLRSQVDSCLATEQFS